MQESTCLSYLGFPIVGEGGKMKMWPESGSRGPGSSVWTPALTDWEILGLFWLSGLDLNSSKNTKKPP